MLILGNCLDILPTLEEKSVHCVVTSPPYFGLRDYGHDDQIGLEPTPDEYVAKLVEVFQQVWRVLRADGTVFLNLGDSYAANGGAHNGRDDNQRGVGAKRTHDANAGDRGKRQPPPASSPKT